MEVIIEVIMFGMVIEGALLAAHHHRTGRGVAPAALLPILASGVLLLLAVLLARAGVAWYWLSSCLLCAGVGHVFDLRARWRGRG